MKLDGVGRLHQQVYRALLGEILGGRLTSGERVPSTRHVAGLLKVSRTPSDFNGPDETVDESVQIPVYQAQPFFG